MSVDLPAPFSPRSPWTVPGSIRMSTPSFAWTEPKVLWMSTSPRAPGTARSPGGEPSGAEAGAPSRSPPASDPVLLIVAPAVGPPTTRSRRARALHALQQLRHVPDLRVGRGLA